jgi:N6-L-threonylcarbamoyladenine synthase
LKERIGRGLKRFRDEFPNVENPALVVAGGVAANTALREMLTALCAENRFRFIAPPHALCTDNAAMIAWAGLERMAAGFEADTLDVAPRSRWPLDASATAVIGYGKRGAKA